MARGEEKALRIKLFRELARDLARTHLCREPTSVDVAVIEATDVEEQATERHADRERVKQLASLPERQPSVSPGAHMIPPYQGVAGLLAPAFGSVGSLEGLISLPFP